MTETYQDLMADLGGTSIDNPATKNLLAAESKYIRDLRMNLKAIDKTKAISAKEAYLVALAIASNQKNDVLMSTFKQKAADQEATQEEIGEAIACASLLSANNVLYRFRHFVEKEKYDNARAGIRMNIMMNPTMGKGLFELISLAVSAVNGCEMCVKSHEESVLAHGLNEEAVWEAIRIASIVTATDRVLR